jgi:hypothetical protein
MLAAPLMLSDRLSVAIGNLHPRQLESVKQFQRDVRETLEIFLRFTHRYWFHAITNHAHGSELFRMWSGHLGTDPLYDEVRQEMQDMNHYLESLRSKRLSDIGLRLGVVATRTTQS